MGTGDFVVVLGSKGRITVELLRFTKPMQIQISWFVGSAQSRDNGGCPSRPHPEATQFSFSLYVSGNPQASPEFLEGLLIKTEGRLRLADTETLRH